MSKDRQQEMLNEMLTMYLIKVGPCDDGHNGTDVPKSIYNVFEVISETFVKREIKMNKLVNGVI